MTPKLLSLHHVTATVAEARPDVAFYTGVLGLRRVKKTVNFDNHGVYHFYYGDEVGTPSTLMTTFPYAGQGVPVGAKGAGQVVETAFSVPSGAVRFWERRLAEADIAVDAREERFGRPLLRFHDPSGLRIEVVEAPDDGRGPWLGGTIPGEVAIRGVHSVTMLVRSAPPTLDFASDVLGMAVGPSERARTRLVVGEEAPGHFLDVVESTDAPPAVNGLGTVHHVALAVEDDKAQAAFRARLVEAGVEVTPVRDRDYFRSIYFREPGGVLYEIATRGPGFLVDESVEVLGEALRLPQGAEAKRTEIAAALPTLDPSPSRPESST